jgi:hypothetical protein
MDKLRIILYMNNKDLRKYACSIEYEYDLDDYDLLVRKKIGIVEGRKQGREEI